MSDKRDAQRTIERIVEEVWNKKRLDVLAELSQPDTKIYRSSGVLEGRDKIRDEFIRPIQSAFPDLRHEIVDMMVEGDKVAMRYVGTGTHQYDFDGKRATGKSFNYEGITLFHLRNNRVNEVWDHSNWSEKFAEL